MKSRRNQTAFTLLEIVIVIIIIGVLATLALPRLFSTIEYSRSAEAWAGITAIRGSMERCYLSRNENYEECRLNHYGSNNLDIPHPGDSPNAHFRYFIPLAGTSGYVIIAQRNTVDGGSGSSMIGIRLDGSTLTKAGKGAFAPIGNSDADWLTDDW